MVRHWVCHAKNGYPNKKSVRWRLARGISNNGLHSEKVVSRGFRTGVRLPSGPPKQKRGFTPLFCFEDLIKGVERSEQNNPVSCFVNGDRRFLRNVTLNLIQNVEQKSRTNPLRQKILQKRIFSAVFFYPSRRLGISSPQGVYHHALACISSPKVYSLRLDEIQHFVLMICNSYGIDDIQGYALIYLQKCDIINSTINKNL